LWALPIPRFFFFFFFAKKKHKFNRQKSGHKGLCIHVNTLAQLLIAIHNTPSTFTYTNT